MDAYRELISMSNLPVNYSFRSTKQEGQIIAHPHWHEAVEVLYMNQGQAMQQLDGVQFPLSEKDIVVIWKNQIHSTISLPGSNCEIQVFQLSYPDVPELAPPSISMLLSEIRIQCMHKFIKSYPICQKN